jgi:hypothetical protein
MQKHDADRVNGAFGDVARKQMLLANKVDALERAIQTQGQVIAQLQKQLSQIAAKVIR